MPSLIEELTLLASDRQSTASELLKKMRIATVRLQLEDTEAWVRHELDGYPDISDVPKYRIIGGSPYCRHSHWGWRPLAPSTNEMNNALTRAIIWDSSINTLDEVVADKPGPFMLTYPPTIEQALMLHMGRGVNSVALQVDRSTMLAVINAVKNRVLEWSLEMERAGVVGESMSFTPEERERAAGVTYNFDMRGDNNRANINSTDNSTNTVNHGKLFGEIRARIDGEVKDPAEQQALHLAVTDMEKQTNKKGLAAAYGRFMQGAANHVQVFSPFVQRIGQILEHLPDL